MCVECENHERYVSEASSSLEAVQVRIKRLDLLTYTEVQKVDGEARNLVQSLKRAKESQRRHREKCEARGG